MDVSPAARWMQTDPSAFDDGPDAAGMRRRLLRHGVGFAPVLLESVPRSSLHGGGLGDLALPAIGASADGAGVPWRPCTGYTPDSWRDPWLAYEWPVQYARSGRDAARFDEVFGEAQYPGLTLLDVLELRPGSGRDEVARHAVAAALNCAKGLTPADLFSIEVLRAMWHSYATLGHCVPVPGVQWYADRSSPPGAGCIVQWLRSTMRR